MGGFIPAADFFGCLAQRRFPTTITVRPLESLDYIPEPDKHYRQISAILFAPPQRRLSDKLIPASTGSKVPISEPEQAWWRR